MIIEFGVFSFPDSWMFDGPEDVLVKVGQDLPWEERAKTKVEATPEMTLSEVTAIGLRKLDITIPANSYVVLPHDYSVVSSFAFEGLNGEHVWIDRYVDQTGREWTQTDLDFVSSKITVADILRTVEAGVLPVNPRRMLVAINVQELGGLFDYFQTAIDAWNLACDYPVVKATLNGLGMTGTFASAVAAVGKLKKKFNDDFGSISKWIQFTEVPRTTKQVANHLGIDGAEVPNICLLFGLEQDRTGVWRISQIPKRRQIRELAGIVDMIARVGLESEDQVTVFTELLDEDPGKRLVRAEAVVQRVQFQRRAKKHKETPQRDASVRGFD